MQTVLGKANPAHNLGLDIIVEQGIFGFFLFAALLAACGWSIHRLPVGERALWVVLALSWFVGVMSLSWGARKITWLLFGLLAARSETEATDLELSATATQRNNNAAGMRMPTLQPIHLPRYARDDNEHRARSF
jgi:O-antigen ligase